MKAILEFDLNDPDDRIAHQKAINGESAHLALWEFARLLRQRMKHGDNDEAQFALLEVINKEFLRVIELYDLKIDD